ncbi:Arsenate reductase thioredoxin-coupled, LMWP family [hydrothermal vent metagenome]|uniref:Arsenate reductase thioredoxin-coupled, LMWP family n=1 Tax=hydrothermal vent metagenome TaxID=652676 RepID=A0A3B0SIV4_9ZZZZ
MEKLILDRLTTLGHPNRMALFRLLMRRYPQAVPAGELGQALGLKASTLSVYLSALAGVGLIDKSRHGTSLHYRVVPEAAREIIDYLFFDCCRGRPQLCAGFEPFPASEHPPEPTRKLNIIFICTGNSARSIMAEAILRDLAPERFNVYSAGTRPATAPHPLALDTLKRNRHDISGLRSENLDEFHQPGAPQMDFIFTVCDAAANEECAIWPGRPISGHWGIPDPASAIGNEAEKALAFARAYGQMRARIEAFTALPEIAPGAPELQNSIDEISTIPTKAKG